MSSLCTSGERQRHGGQGRPIHLGVNGRGVDAHVAEHVGDRFNRHARVHHPRREAMPKPVRAPSLVPGPHAVQVAAHDMDNRIGRGHWAWAWPMAQEDPSHIHGGPAMKDVVRESGTDFMNQR